MHTELVVFCCGALTGVVVGALVSLVIFLRLVNDPSN